MPVARGQKTFFFLMFSIFHFFIDFVDVFLNIFFCGNCSVFSFFFAIYFNFLEFVLECVDCIFQLFFDIVLSISDFFRFFRFFFGKESNF